MPINSIDARPAYGTSYLKGSLDASLAANLPAVKLVGDIYDISVAGSFENDASILPASAYFSVPDQIRWNGTNWVKMEAGDNISDAAFDASWDGNVNNAPSKNAIYDETIKKVNILDASTAGFGFVIDEDNLVSDLDTKVPTQQSVKAYADAKISDATFDATWDEVTSIAPSKNAVYDKFISLGDLADKDVVVIGDIDSGAATSGQVLTADGSGGVSFQDQTGGGGGASVSDADFDASWNGVTTVAPSKNAVYDAFSNVDNTSDANKPVSTAQQTALDLKVDDTEKGAANGVATLDANSQLTTSQIPSSIASGLTYLGSWNADTNTPTLSDGSGSAGEYYKVSTAGTTEIDGISSWGVGDWIISSDTAWDRIAQTETVSSVAGKTGTVTLVKGDVGLGNVDNTSDANKPVSTAQETAINAKVSDTAFAGSWDAVTTIAPSKNAVYDVLNPIKTKSDQNNVAANVATQTYTILNTDHGKTLFFTFAGAVTITAPQSLADTVHVTCVPVDAATTLAFVAGSGATLNSKGGLLNVTDQYSAATLVHRGSNAWYVFGDLS
jgi:hypothetical protein